jgi:hypothetical protein
MVVQPLDCVVSLSVGEALTFPGQLLHGGAGLTSGVRYVLVGFGNIKTRQLSFSEADSADVGAMYDYPADVFTGAAYRVVEGTTRGPRLVVLPRPVHTARQDFAIDDVAAPMIAPVAVQEEHHLGISVIWDGCPEQHAFELKS